MIEILGGDYDPETFDNPALQKYWAGLERQALGEGGEWEDFTLPDVEWQDQRPEILEFMKSYGGDAEEARGSARDGRAAAYEGEQSGGSGRCRQYTCWFDESDTGIAR